MKISENLGDLNHKRFHSFETPFTKRNAKAALYLFKGDVYGGLDPYTLNKSEVDYLDHHLLILSGLYGVLQPLDLIQPYRLEMGTRFKNARGENLYQFWGDRLTHYLNELIDANHYSAVINLASNEYFKAIDPKALNAPIITPIFKDLNKKGEHRVISFYAKKARGMMVRYACKQNLTCVDELKSFTEEGYYFKESNQAGELLFLRDEKP